jgi:hypothetical protein
VSAPSARFAVLAPGGTDAPAAGCDLRDVADWFDAVSGGAWAPAPDAPLTLRLDHPLARYARDGGLSARAPNSRDLLAAALAALDAAGRARVAAAGGRVLLVVPLSFRPHAWHPARGGIPLGSGGWCRRYALVPSAAPLGTVAHELGHLLCDWPDGSASAGAACLMALGGLRAQGRDPAPPAAPLALQAGWRRALPLHAGTRLDALDAATVGTYHGAGAPIWVERRDGRLLAWTGPALRPQLLADLPSGERGEATVLGLLAPSLRAQMAGQGLDPAPAR